MTDAHDVPLPDPPQTGDDGPLEGSTDDDMLIGGYDPAGLPDADGGEMPEDVTEEDEAAAALTDPEAGGDPVEGEQP